MISGYGLFWRFAARGILTVELAAACARFQERTGGVATVLEVHPGEIVEAPGLVVEESGRVRPGTWMVSGE